MRLKRIISGGQTGGDRTGLEEAKARGIETGGTAPRGYRTEDGNDPSLKDFGLVEDASSGYPPRTRKNVKDANTTVWFGNVGSPGYTSTENAANDYKKPLFVNPSPDEFMVICELYEVVNIAGNRKSKNPKVVGLVRDAFKALDTPDCTSKVV